MYSHKKIIFVNSGSNAFCEFPVDRNTLLKATGNAGKSSILNALKLVWLPEVSFAGAEKKFKFVSKGSDKGFYSGEESHSYYFPTIQTSFIIYEVENHHGYHCQILYPRARMGYGRIMARCCFEQISDLFWIKGGGDLGLGEPNPCLSTAFVLSELKTREIEFEDITTAKRLTEVLYTDSLLDNDAQFALFPLKSQDDSAIETLRSLIHTICGFKAGSSELGNLFANIIESKKKDESDFLNLDLFDILHEREALSMEEKSLNELESLRPVANDVSGFSSVIEALNTDLGVKFLTAQESLKNAYLKVNSESLAISTSIKDLKEKHTVLKCEKETHTKARDEANGELKANKRNYEACVKIVERGKEVRKEYVGMKVDGKDGIIDWLTDFIKDETEQLKALQNEAERSAKKNALLSEQDELNSDLKKVASSIAKFEQLLFRDLNTHIGCVLASINVSFRAVTLDSFDELNTDDVIDKLEKFSTLFVDAGGFLTFGNVKFKKCSADLTIAELEAQLQTLENRLSDVKQELETFAAFDSGDEKAKAKQIKEKQQQIRDAQEDMRIVHEYVAEKRKLPALQQLVESCQNRYNNSKAELDSVKAQIRELRSQLAEKSEASSALSAKATSLKQLSDRLAQANNTSVFNVLLERTDRTGIKSDILVTTDLVNQISHKMGQYKTATDNLRRKLAELVSANILEDVEKLTFSADSTYFSLKFLIEDLKGKFDQVEPRRSALASNKASHKSMIAMKVQELRRNAEAIDVFEKSINVMFSNLHINNLEGVKASITMDERFTDLITQIEKNDLHGDEEMSESFYERLSAFIDVFFTNGEAKELTMDKIIKSVAFKTKKVGQDWVETSQSNSSCSLITITLLQKMMREIMNPDIETSIPLIIDEVAHIDESEFPWLIANIIKDGFRLLCASTNNISVYALEEIGSECCIDEFQVTKAYSAGRNTVFFAEEGKVDVAA